MSRFRRQLVSWAKVLASQALAIAIFWAVRDMLPTGGPAIVIPLLVLQGLVAALAGKLLGLSPFWFPIQMIIPFALVYGGAVPAWGYLLAFVAIALVFWNSPSERVPLYLTNSATRVALGKLIKANEARHFIDLGCGTGGVVVGLARTHPDLSATGVETAPPVFAIAWLNAVLRGKSRAHIRFQSLWKTDLASFDIVYCFLSPAPMARLYAKASAEMRDGTVLVSNSFAVGDHEPEHIIAVNDARKTQLFVYRIKSLEGG